MDFSVGEFVSRALKYLVEGLAVAIAAVFIPKKSLPLEEIASLALVAAAVFALLDVLAPSIGVTARQGAGFGVGANLVGFPMR
jgi:ABC-type Co2+ transport system permease subunit